MQLALQWLVYEYANMLTLNATVEDMFNMLTWWHLLIGTKSKIQLMGTSLVLQVFGHKQKYLTIFFDLMVAQNEK